jgi:lipopolysaccharide biosynthesis glycosyltransferase
VGDVIELVLAFDDNFWAPAYATMRSVCLTSARPADLRFHVLHSGLTAANRAVIESIGTDYGARLHFVDLDAGAALSDRIAAFPPIRMKRFRPIIYARLLLGELLDPAIERVLYLDSDLFVRSPIETLYHMDLAGMALGAVRQPDRHHCIAGRDLRERTVFSMAEPYYNSGVLLIDMAQYREMDFAQVLREQVAPDQLALFYYDQDIINLAFRGRILDLDPRWNLQNPEPAHEALDPHILHYSADARPWLPWSRVAFKRTYRHLMTNAYYYRYRRERLVHALGRLARIR